MSEASESAGIADRYATAIFEIARDDGRLDDVERDADALSAALRDSDTFRELIHSPIYGRDAQERGVAALGERMGLSDVVTNTLRLMAQKRRLFVLSDLARRLREIIAREKGEVTASVTSAQPLSDGQRDEVRRMLSEVAGRDVKLETRVDESLIAGLVVQLGSRMVDTSLRTKLNSLKMKMKEAG